MNTFQDPNRKTKPFSSGFNCRTCEDFKTWTTKQSSTLHSEQNSNETPRKHCPFDGSVLGNSTWGLLHTMSVAYPENPTDQQKTDVKNFMDILTRMYPCETCARDLAVDLIQNPVDASSGKIFSQWLCNLHNRVNKKLGKPLFDCSKTYERWRDGWLDGSCD